MGFEGAGVDAAVARAAAEEQDIACGPEFRIAVPFRHAVVDCAPVGLGADDGGEGGLRLAGEDDEQRPRQGQGEEEEEEGFGQLLHHPSELKVNEIRLIVQVFQAKPNHPPIDHPPHRPEAASKPPRRRTARFLQPVDTCNYTNPPESGVIDLGYWKRF